MSTLSEDELRSRIPVWEALADFWLDTELDLHRCDAIARAMAASPYTLHELRAIHDYEVAPAVWANLSGTAGEWVGFDAGWLRQRCQRLAEQRGSPWLQLRVWWQRPFFWSSTARYWRQVVPRVQALRRETMADA